MQSVAAAFTATEKAPFRQIAESMLISWHNQSLIGNRTFTIGVSTIGGNDVIGQNVGAIGSPSNYKYFDESTRLISASWERGYNMPKGGLTMALGDARFDNNSRRYTPRHMGGNSEISTAIQPGKPVMVSAGFNVSGIDQMLPQFVGVISEQPQVTVRDRQMSLKMQDYVYYFQSKKLDTAVVFTGQRTDQVMTTLATQLGMSTAQYDFDPGINIIPYGAFDVGITFASAFGDLAEAENGHVYFDETGILKFENRQHWGSAPYTQVQKVITTAMVIDQESTDESHIVNAVEVHSGVYVKQPEQTIFRLNTFDTLLVPGNSTASIFVNFDDPVLSMTTPAVGGVASFWLAYANNDGTGTDLTGNLSVTNVARFAQSAKITFRNSSPVAAYMNTLVITGRVARNVSPIYTRATIGHSITAYQEQLLSIDNRFIQNQSWAESLANMILQDFANPENIQKITVRAMPGLQLGDLVSWQGRYWRLFDIKTTIDPSIGFTQELTMLQRTITTYFRIGISTIGGTDKIAP
jgi:hypothetical protein